MNRFLCAEKKFIRCHTHTRTHMYAIQTHTSTTLTSNNEPNRTEPSKERERRIIRRSKTKKAHAKESVISVEVYIYWKRKNGAISEPFIQLFQSVRWFVNVYFLSLSFNRLLLAQSISFLRIGPLMFSPILVIRPFGCLFRHHYHHTVDDFGHSHRFCSYRSICPLCLFFFFISSMP